MLPEPSPRVYARKLDGEQEARSIAPACSGPPEGKKRWTLRSLAQRMVEPEGRSSPNRATRRCAKRSKKNALKPHLRRMWCIPPKHSAESVWHLEDVLEVYRRPYDPKRPVVCLDECSKRPVGEVRTPPPPRPAQGERPGRAERCECEYEYVRNGTADLFLAFEPLGGWREAQVTDRRRRGDRARFVRDVVDGPYKDADRVIAVMDRLDIHSPASLYQAFAPEEVKRLVDRFEIHHTPKHGSWLNMVEIEFGALGRDLPDRVEDKATLERHVTTWQCRRDAAAIKADWRFTTKDARIKLRELYPTTHG